MSILQRLLRRISPTRRFAHEYRVAEQLSALLTPLLTSSAKACGLSFSAVPLNTEANLLIGFLASIHDVYAQSLEGEPGGPGSINGTIKTYQALFGELKAETLMNKTFDLYTGNDPEFEKGRFYWTKFANALLQRDTHIPSLIAVGVFGEHYKRYCK